MLNPAEIAREAPWRACSVERASPETSFSLSTTKSMVLPAWLAMNVKPSANCSKAAALLNALKAAVAANTLAAKVAYAATSPEEPPPPLSIWFIFEKPLEEDKFDWAIPLLPLITVSEDLPTFFWDLSSLSWDFASFSVSFWTIESLSPFWTSWSSISTLLSAIVFYLFALSCAAFICLCESSIARFCINIINSNAQSFSSG